ncbi:hypothetical protein C2845_PM05G36290 [Panicum miliaceum]|uniref:Transcription factor MYB98-like n=1 Tax=Panicum miliaceum TaxID=4540 RepID=A0A3L6SXH6_PANMI|nr:hypothetical protein C2845_PM05G36290 [Panicum miliaceum]
MAFRFGDRSVFREPAAAERTTPSTRIGAISRSLLQEHITGTLPAPDLYIPEENQGGDMYGTSPYPLIAAGDVHLGGSNHAAQDGKVPRHDATGFMWADDLDYGNAICGNQTLMENTIPSESFAVTIDMVASEAYAEEDASTYKKKRGLWTPNEDSKLRELVNKLGERKWSKIAKDLPGRIGKQCRERWLNHLKPGNKKDPFWTEEEDLMLVAWHRKLGPSWAEMAKYIPGRPENSLKNHWNATWRRVKNSKTIEMAVKDGTHPNVLVVYMVRECGALKGAGAPASAADPPVPDAVPDGWQADDNPAATEPSPGSNSPDHCWLPMLCGGMLPPPIMEAPAPLPDNNNAESCVYATYDADGYVRYVHLQPTPGHDGYAPANQVAAAAEAAGYYNPLTFPYNPFAGQQVYAHTTYPAGTNYQEAEPSHYYSNSGAGGDDAHGNAGTGSAAPELAGMPFSANAPAAQ